MKPPATTTQHEVVLDDFNSHILNDKHNISKVIDSSVLKQPTHTALESQQVPTTTMAIVNIDRMKAFQECMDSYGILNGVPEFDIVALAIAFYESTCNTQLVITKSSANNYQQYSCKVHEGCNFCVSFGQHCSTGLHHMKKFNFIHNGYITEKQYKKWQEIEDEKERTIPSVIPFSIIDTQICSDAC